MIQSMLRQVIIIIIMVVVVVIIITIIIIIIIISRFKLWAFPGTSTESIAASVRLSVDRFCPSYVI
jgi:hypothetical protein